MTRNTLVDVHPLTKSDLDAALESLYQRIKKDTAAQVTLLEEQNKRLKEIVDKQNAEIQLMRSSVVSLAAQFEQISRKERADFAIINGVDESISDVNAWVLKLSGALNLQIDNSFKPIRLGKTARPNKTRPIKVKFQTEKDKRDAIHNCRKLFNDNAGIKRLFGNQKKLFINFDESPTARRESARLREARKIAIRDNPDKSVQIRRGRLYLDDVQIDEWDIANQYFC